MPTAHFDLLELEQMSVLLQVSRTTGLLDALLERAGTAADLASRLKLNDRATRLWLETLATMGFLTQAGEVFSASAAYRDLRSDISVKWEHFPVYLRTGEPWMQIDASMQSIDEFYTGFFSCIDYAQEMAAAADAIAARLGNAPVQLLDIGCGTGVWSLAMARRHPTARVTGVDLPVVLKRHFLRRAAELGLSDRVATISGDFHDVPLPREAFDRVTFGQSFHFVQEQKVHELIGRVAATLRRGGELVIIDHFANDSPSTTLSRLLYEQRLAMRTMRAKNYSRGEIEQLCSEAGLDVVGRFAVDGPGFLAVLVFRNTQS